MRVTSSRRVVGKDAKTRWSFLRFRAMLGQLCRKHKCQFSKHGLALYPRLLPHHPCLPRITSSQTHRKHSFGASPSSCSVTRQLKLTQPFCGGTSEENQCVQPDRSGQNDLTHPSFLRKHQQPLWMPPRCLWCKVSTEGAQNGPLGRIFLCNK